MSLYLTYIRKSNFELMTILENSENYTPEALDVVREIFDEKKLEGEELRKLAVEVNQQIIEETIQKLDPLNDELNFHKSEYLDSAEIKEMYLTILKKHMDRKEGFKFNVWLYALGG